VQVAIPVPAYERLGRLCKIYDRSQAKLVEILLLNCENGWLKQLPDEELRRRYFSGELDRDEAYEVRLRVKVGTPHPPEPREGMA
jgi:hypothetical protein